MTDKIPGLLDEFFDDPTAEWTGMPAFEHDDLTAFHKVIVHFRCRKDVDRFAALVDQKIGMNTRSLWFPSAEIRLYGIAR